ncbi:serine/threonine protein kinase [Streptomyces sp. 6N223]|uniref:serine/threonine protein kinase n=1 Tax=Streptomyces sp. 6N223 TaxID=3457412 RepID=UPI003FCFD4A5
MLGRGTVLGERYTLTERLGGGAMGEVWRADDGVFERQVAVKILHPRLLDEATFAARFRREAKLLAALSHPGIVNVHDYGESGGDEGEDGGGGGDDSGVRLAYIVMEFIDGTPLDEVLAERGPLPVERALDMVAQALEGLHAAHRREIVHRDIKPANLMLRADGRVTVTDFGIARTPSGTKLTDSHSVIGTALYMAPEQAEGLGAIPASDLYSIGVVLYQLLTGELPFTGETAVQVLLKQIREPAPELPAAFPEPVRAFVAKALAKRPEDRHADAAAMAAAARRAATGQPPEPEPEPAPLPAAGPAPTPAPPPPAPPPGHAAQGKADDTIVLAAKRKQKQGQERKRRRIPVVLLLPVVITLGGGTFWYMDPLPDHSETDVPEAGDTPAASGGQSPDSTPPGSASPSATESESESESDDDPNGSPSDDADGGGGDDEDQAGSGGDASGGQGGDGSGTSGGGSSGGGSASGGGSGDPDPSDPDPDPDPGPSIPQGCGSDGWGHITNVHDGRKAGLAADRPQDGTEVITGGTTTYGWVRSSQQGGFTYFTACNLSSPSLAVPYGMGGVELTSGYDAATGWTLESASSGAYYLRTMDGRCLTNNGEGEQLTVITCTTGNESQMWRIPEA